MIVWVSSRRIGMKDLVTARRVGAFVVSVLAVSALVGSAREGCPDTLELQDGCRASP
jgi:hypothetical protein